MALPVQEEQGWVILEMPERFNAAVIDGVGDQFSTLLTRTAPVKIMLDFAPVRYIDSTGIGSLIRLFGSCKERQGRLVMVGCRDNVLKIFKLVNLQRFIPAFPDRAAAFQATSA